MPALDFEVMQRGTVPVEPVSQSIVDAHKAAVYLLLSEVAQNVSGRVVQSRTGNLRDALAAKIVMRPGLLVGTVGFNKDVAYIARFLERGVKPHQLGKGARTARRAYGGRKARNARDPYSGARSVVMPIPVGAQVIFRRNAKHPGLMPRPILESAIQAVWPQIGADFRLGIKRALNG